MNRFQEIIDAWLDGEITDYQILQLNRAILESDELAREFAFQIQVNSLLRECYTNDAHLATVLQAPLTFDDVGCLQKGSKFTNQSQSSYYRILLVLASILVIAWIAFSQIPPQAVNQIAAPASQSIKESSPPVAVVDTVDIPDPAEAQLSVRQTLFPNDRIQIPAGTLSLQLHQGTRLALTAPADLQLISANQARLREGHLLVQLTASAPDLTIQTHFADIVGLQSSNDKSPAQWTVHATRAGTADINVFQGKVVVYPDESATSSARPRQLAAGDTLRVGGAPSQVSNSASPQDSSSPLIASISDSLASNSPWTYYRLFRNAFDEDALSYLDRPYQWNSLPGVPFPEPLRGRDYLCLANELKHAWNFQLRIRLKRPTDVYVLADDRLPPPDWLTHHFTKTSMTIGMDEYDPRAQFDRTYPPNAISLGIGPGESVDRSFDIWVRHCLEAEEVVLGDVANPSLVVPANAPQSNNDHAPRWPPLVVKFPRSMYGVVFAPTETTDITPTPSSENSPSHQH